MRPGSKGAALRCRGLGRRRAPRHGDGRGPVYRWSKGPRNHSTGPCSLSWARSDPLEPLIQMLSVAPVLLAAVFARFAVFGCRLTGREAAHEPIEVRPRPDDYDIIRQDLAVVALACVLSEPLAHLARLHAHRCL